MKSNDDNPPPRDLDFLRSITPPTTGKADFLALTCAVCEHPHGALHVIWRPEDTCVTLICCNCNNVAFRLALWERPKIIVGSTSPPLKKREGYQYIDDVTDSVRYMTKNLPIETPRPPSNVIPFKKFERQLQQPPTKGPEKP